MIAVEVTLVMFWIATIITAVVISMASVGFWLTISILKNNWGEKDNTKNINDARANLDRDFY